MLLNYKAMIVVLFLTTISFMVAQPLFTRFMSTSDFRLRRNTWLALTVAAFVIPEFWTFTIVFALIVLYASKRDSNPVAMYFFLLLVLPPISKYISVPGLVGNFMAIEHLRVLCLIVLLPVYLRLSRSSTPRESISLQGANRGITAPDLLLISYLLLQLGLTFPYARIGGLLRISFEMIFFTLIPYFAISRTIQAREKIIECLATFVMSLLVLVPIGVFETVRNWVLYATLQDNWGGSDPIENLMRGSFLRAQATAGHSLVFGFSLAIALGGWLFLQSRIAGRGWRWLGLVTLCTGLIASFARGGWIGAIVIVAVISLAGPRAGRRVVTVGAVLLFSVGLVSLTPYASNIIEYIPFVGGVGEESFDYRRQIAAVSWNIIKLNPFFGSFNNAQYLEELRTGQGIVDIVNTYAGIAMTYGGVGLALYTSFYLALISKGMMISRKMRVTDADGALLGVVIAACLIGALVMISAVSQYLSIPPVQLGIAALMAGYIASTYASPDLSFDRKNQFQPA